ncbi:MAG: helix-turn-helix domain-containing protein [Nitrospiraceae bacterium]|nr:helix-turn-helix domain-containing protein [Nitrospiraceae bacterium]
MPLVSVKQAAQELNCSESFLRKQMGQADFPHYRLGSDVRLDLTELRTWFRGKNQEAK